GRGWWVAAVCWGHAGPRQAIACRGKPGAGAAALHPARAAVGSRLDAGGDGSVGGHVMDELSQYLFEPLWAEGEFVLSRSVRDAALAPLLVLAPVRAQPAPQSLQRLAPAPAPREA